MKTGRALLPPVGCWEVPVSTPAGIGHGGVVSWWIVRHFIPPFCPRVLVGVVNKGVA